jgi:hypothetical protein
MIKVQTEEPNDSIPEPQDFSQCEHCGTWFPSDVDESDCGACPME